MPAEPARKERLMPDLKPAAALAAAASKPYTNDGAEYQAARIALLAEEIERRRHIECIAARRRGAQPVARGTRRPAA